MLGFGLNGLWAVTNGRFARRSDVAPDEPKVTAEPEQIRQNADHG
jgi:hypothetical protein